MLATHVRHRSRFVRHSVQFGFPGTEGWAREVVATDVDAEQAHPSARNGECGDLGRDPFADPVFATRVDGSAPRWSPWS
ncbi:MAG TPA: hypothetical protein VFL14_00210 [Xanthomonadales bacterium]|nr:hypothetical protein [Xanthomonadales bacterium]